MKTAIMTLCAVLMASSALAQGSAAGGRGTSGSGGSAAGSTSSGAGGVDAAGSTTADRTGSDAGDIDAVAGSIGTEAVGDGAMTAPDVTGVPLVEGAQAPDVGVPLVEQAPGAGVPLVEGEQAPGTGALVGRGVPAPDGQAGSADSAGRATQSETQSPVVVQGGQPVVVLPPRDGLTQSGNANLQQMTEGVGGDIEPQMRRPGRN